jgi:hypothetical protein
MVVDNYSIISYRERKRERNDKVENESKSDDIKNFENIVYRDERRRLCSELPRPITSNQTPPPHSQPNKILLSTKQFLIMTNIILEY